MKELKKCFRLSDVSRLWAQKREGIWAFVISGGIEVLRKKKIEQIRIGAIFGRTMDLKGIEMQALGGSDCLRAFEAYIKSVVSISLRAPRSTA